jgi:hypothetical protein
VAILSIEKHDAGRFFQECVPLFTERKWIMEAAFVFRKFQPGMPLF